MKFRITLLALTLFTIPAVAQQAVQQSGSVTRGHVPYWVTSGVIGDGGSATNSPISSIGVTNNGGAGICISSDVQTAAGRNQLCFGASTAGAATISLQNYGAASAQNLNFVINGAVLQFPTSAIPLPVSSGGTGATTGSGAQVNLGLGTMAVQNANNVTITGGAITGLPTPVVAADAAIKSYVDALATGLNILASSTLATAAILPNSPTYANGAAGVGATLTAGSNTTLTVDGAAAPLNTVVLVKNQASAFQNGIYTVTTAGSGAAAWVLTRVSYFNTAAQMKAGSYTFITTGSVNANASYVLGATIVTVGTDALNFNQFSLSGGGVTNIGGVTGAITLGSGLTIGGSSLSTQYVPTGAGAVARPVQAKLGESVSIKDFGADSTGSADSLAAVNNAIASGALSIYAP